MGYPRKLMVFAYEALPEPAKWFGHCRSSPDSNNNYYYNSLHLTVKDLLDGVKGSVLFANKRGNDIKQRFVSH
jgi:hypothetical protein